MKMKMRWVEGMAMSSSKISKRSDRAEIDAETNFGM